jgi:hypothetical protein
VVEEEVEEVEGVAGEEEAEAAAAAGVGAEAAVVQLRRAIPVRWASLAKWFRAASGNRQAAGMPDRGAPGERPAG